jgi:hypothetical protein
LRQWPATGLQLSTARHLSSVLFSWEYEFLPHCILSSFAAPSPTSCHLLPSTRISRPSLRSLRFTLAQFIPSASPVTGSGHEDEVKSILLTSPKLDSWLVHVGRPDGRWWKGMSRKRHGKGSCMRIDSLSTSSHADVLRISALEGRRHVIRTCLHLRLARCSHDCSA